MSSTTLLHWLVRIDVLLTLYCHQDFLWYCSISSEALRIRKADHSSNLLLPAYMQTLKQSEPAVKTVHCWSKESDSALQVQVHFRYAYWEVSYDASSGDIYKYTEAVTGILHKCLEDVVSTKTIWLYPNQKPWINNTWKAALRACTCAVAYGNKELKKKDPSKQQNRTENERLSSNWSQEACGRDCTWCQILKRRNVRSKSLTLPDEVNMFLYSLWGWHQHARKNPSITIFSVDPGLRVTEADVQKFVRHVNIHKPLQVNLPAS